MESSKRRFGYHFLMVATPEATQHVHMHTRRAQKERKLWGCDGKHGEPACGCWQSSKIHDRKQPKQQWWVDQQDGPRNEEDRLEGERKEKGVNEGGRGGG